MLGIDEGFDDGRALGTPDGMSVGAPLGELDG